MLRIPGGSFNPLGSTQAGSNPPTSNEQSDVDLIAEFGASVDGRGLADRYLDFAEEAERLLGRKVDLLTENSIRNPIFRSQIEADRKVLYEASTAQATG